MAASIQPVELRSLPGNDVCCDCGEIDPDWASINLGILICLKCSGVHRRLGVHISQVRSLELDRWDAALVEKMSMIGNAAFNRVWQGAIPAGTIRIDEYPENDHVRVAFITAKYRDRLFAAQSFDDGYGQRPRVRRIKEGTVNKLSGGMGVLRNKWDKRLLQLNSNMLSYSTSAKKEKGTFSVENCDATFEDEEHYKGKRRHLFSVVTPAGGFTGGASSTQGRRFVFECSSAEECVGWIQAIRYALSDLEQQKTPPPPLPSSSSSSLPAPIVCSGLSSMVEGMKAEVLDSLEGMEGERTCVRTGEAQALSRPNDYGVWGDVIVAVKNQCLFVLRNNESINGSDSLVTSSRRIDNSVAIGSLGLLICAVPLKFAELESERSGRLPRHLMEAGSGQCCLGVWFPLGCIVLKLQSPEERNDWLACIQNEIDS